MGSSGCQQDHLGADQPDIQCLRYVNKGGHIELAAHRIGPNIHLSVRDDGPGIPPEYQSKIFQKFVQVKGQEAGGTGLGLAICKEIVRAHGGAIWVESSPGSRQHLYLHPAGGPNRRNPWKRNRF